MARDVILPPSPIQITEIKEDEHLAQGLLAVPNGSWKPLEAAKSDAFDEKFVSTSTFDSGPNKLVQR